MAVADSLLTLKTAASGGGDSNLRPRCWGTRVKALGRQGRLEEPRHLPAGWRGCGRSHPCGRELGSDLWIILHGLAERGLPPPTAILVQKGELHPEEGPLSYIRGALGNFDIDALQRQVFEFE